jgi:uncharacterized membrane protein YhaH (DUF805 family)
MFQNPFSFNGRIRRTEYGISCLIYGITIFILNVIEQKDGSSAITIIGLIAILWFIFAQAAKRCHDRGNSGWYQLIPFYGFWMLFADSDKGINEYGLNPKGIGNPEQTGSI